MKNSIKFLNELLKSKFKLVILHKTFTGDMGYSEWYEIKWIYGLSWLPYIFWDELPVKFKSFKTMDAAEQYIKDHELSSYSKFKEYMQEYYKNRDLNNKIKRDNTEVEIRTTD